jgi:hypothetical protein
MHRYQTWNGAMPTTAAQASVTTGTSIKNMLQLSTPATRQIQLIAWGFSLDDPPGADGVIEIIQSDVASTSGTAHVAAGVQPLTPGQPASLLTLGTGNTGYSFSTLGTPTATRVFDVVSLSSATGESPLSYEKIWVPDARPIIAVSTFVQVRATTPTTAVDMRCWIVWDE